MSKPNSTPDDKPVICSICFRPIEAFGSWWHGHDAEPINNGRCCDVCNDMVVIPARIARLRGVDQDV